MPSLGIEIKRMCVFCSKEFIINILYSYYCSPKCSKAAHARKKRAEEKERKMALIAKMVPTIREFISVKEAVAIYGVERQTLYRLLRKGIIPCINIT